MNDNRQLRTRLRQTVLAVITTAGTLCLASCGDKEPEATVKDPETTPTQVSINHRSINSENGKRQYRMEAPVVKRYELAKEPFMEFPDGIKVETFDSLLRIESDLVADYAHFNETTSLWEARGNVVAHNYEGENGGRTLYTERLFWDQNKKKIYNDTLARVVDGGDVHVGRNFEADEAFETWSFHHTTGKLEVDPQALQDTTSATPSSPSSPPVATASADSADSAGSEGKTAPIARPE